METKKMKDGFEDVLFNDIFEEKIEITEEVRQQNTGKIFVGNIRMNQGKYRTDEEKEKYRKETLERELP